MSPKRLLITTQLSNYDTRGKFILEADSGWQMCMGRVRVMLGLNPNLDATIMGPLIDESNSQCITHPFDVNPDLWERYGSDGENRLHYVEHHIIPNALVTRYDFDWTSIAVALDLGMQKIGQVPKWDVVYVNDPLHLRNFKAMFHIVGGYQPKFAVHSHFIDNPSCPKFPKEASLWLGQCEAAIRADVNFWQCRSAMDVFFREASQFFNPEVVKYIASKSYAWDDGYSSEEINTPVDESSLRFDVGLFNSWRNAGKKIVFLPNRIGGRGRSSDYTNCGKFMFELLPQLAARRNDYVVIAGNPSQKFRNDELAVECGPHGYVSLVPDALRRDEFRFVARNSDIALGLYDQDSYGGTVARECVELGCVPLWLDNYEYKSIAVLAGLTDKILCKVDFSDTVDVLSRLLDDRVETSKLKDVVRDRCSYEKTTHGAMIQMGIAPDQALAVM